MERFHIIEEGAAILRVKGGLQKQVKVYRRGQDVFAAHGGGFLKLHGRNGTANPNVSWLDLEADGVTTDRVGGQPRYEDPAVKIAAE